MKIMGEHFMFECAKQYVHGGISKAVGQRIRT